MLDIFQPLDSKCRFDLETLRLVSAYSDFYFDWTVFMIKSTHYIQFLSPIIWADGSFC